MTWFEKLGFSSNPLDCRPNDDLVGLGEEFSQLINYIEKGDICFLNGLTGSGKSSLMLKLQRELPNHVFVYLDAQDLPKDFNLEEELKNKRNFFDRITFREFPKKTPVLLIDEFQATDKNLVLEARGKWESQNSQRIKSIIVAQIDKTLRNVTPAFLERIGNRVVTLRVLDDDEMKEVVRRRLSHDRVHGGYAGKLSDEALELLVFCADGNPRRLLEYTEMLFDFHHRKFKDMNPLLKKEDYEITYWGAREILQLNKIDVEAYEEKRKKGRVQPEARKGKSFEGMFSKEEQLMVKYFMTGPKTYDEVAEYFHLSPAQVQSRLKDLKDKRAIIPAGKKDNKKLWRVAPHVKRLTVRV
ncbi:MAG: AAA family ATPase [Nanoarchaeota archaeon]